jgi:hypothetical protein
MKKSIFIIAALLAATFSKAELTPDYTLPSPNSSSYIMPADYLAYDEQLAKKFQTALPQCPFLLRYNSQGDNATYYTLTLLNPFDYSEYKTIDPVLFNNDNYKLLAVVYDVFVVDKLAFLLAKTDGSSFKIIDEDGNVILEQRDQEAWLGITRFGSVWKLVTMTSYGSNGVISKIYTFPGDGSMLQAAQAISNPSPKRNARKIARDGQVLVETENNTYTLTGTEAK